MVDVHAQETAIESLPSEAFVYLLPSRFCWPDVLHDAAWELFGDVAPGWSRVQAVSDWVHANIRYEVGASTTVTTAYDVWESRTVDPRNNEPRVGRVVIARGRDALDGAMVTTWGAAELTLMEVWADEVS